MRRILFFSPVAALLMIAASSPTQAQAPPAPRVKEAGIENPSTTITTQGAYTLIDYPQATSTQLWGVNSRGEMIGVYVSADKVTHGFLYSHGQFKSIDYPGSALTLANGINAQGDIVGEYALTATGPHHGFVLSGGRFTTIDYPDGSSTGVIGIAANGDMAGYYGSPNRGYLLHGDQFTTVDCPGAPPTVIGGVSPQGDILASCSLNGVSYAILIHNGETTSWSYPGNVPFTNALARNAAGDIVGRYRDGAAVSHGYLLSNGKFSSFDCPGATFTGNTGITPDGDMVGRCTVGGVSHGYYLKRGQRPSYTVTDLGTLGGNASVALGVNNAGAVSGGANVANGDQHPFLFSGGKMTDLGSLGGGNGAGSIPTGALQIAVASETAKLDPFGGDFCGYGTKHICLAAIWKDGHLTGLPTLGGNNAIGFAFNEVGQMVGVSEKAILDPTCPAPRKQVFAPVIWGPNPGDVRELRLPDGDTSGWALLINDKGEAVGSTGNCGNTFASVNGLLSGPRAVLWENGVPRDLGSFGSTTNNVAISINNRSEIIGGSGLADDSETHSFLWSRENGLEDIGSVGSDPNGLASSINNARQVVGGSCDADFNCRAFLWERYVMTDLNDLVQADSTMYMMFATWINDVGQITGYGLDKRTNEVHAFLASPTQPSTAGGTLSAPRPMPVFSAQIRNQLRKRLAGHPGLPRQ